MAATAEHPSIGSDLVNHFYRISLDLYRRIGELGLISVRERVVLLDGMLVKKMTKSPRHVTTTHCLYEAFLRQLPDGCHPRFHSPTELPGGPDGDSVPEPDVAVALDDLRNYMSHHPGPADVLLAIEVADSSLTEDRKALRRYAWAGLPIVWIVNLRRNVIEVYSRPSGPVDDAGYGAMITRGPGETVEVVLGDLPPIILNVADLLA